MPTIDDVAKRAGVSKMTVSRAINGSGYVSDKTRARVEQAIEDLDFRPNMMAKGLASGRRTNTIAHVMVDVEDMIHALVNKGIEEACYERGYSTIVCDANAKDRENNYISMIIDKQMSGAVFHHLDINAAQVNWMHEAGVKCVLVDNENDVKHARHIRTNNYRGGYLAAEHLIERGHTKLGCMFGVMDLPEQTEGHIEYVDTFQYNIWKDRTRGFCDCIEAHGLQVNKDYFFQGDGTLKYGLKKAYEIMSHILSLEDRPTAVYCQNDIMALGALNAVLEKKLDVPAAVAIIGHDGIQIINSFQPRISTIVQPQYQTGYLAANMLIDLIEEKETASYEPVLLEPELAIGGTT